jgi:hypothetical protein
MMSLLEEFDIADIIISKGKYKCIDVNKVECDLYELLNGNEEYIDKYSGQYLHKYSWAEERNGQLYSKIRKGWE